MSCHISSNSKQSIFSAFDLHLNNYQFTQLVYNQSIKSSTHLLLMSILYYHPTINILAILNFSFFNLGSQTIHQSN